MKPRFGAIDETDETTKAHNSTLVLIFQTAAAYCQLFGKHKAADFLDRWAHFLAAHTEQTGNVTALKD